MSPPAAALHPCQQCGACCASFRVDFSTHESQDAGGQVPAGLAVEVNDNICRMRGTDHAPPRCAALTGKIGERVACGIYEWRPSPCREFEAGSQACERARARHGMPPLSTHML
ncbi:MAG TPA: YkgJ family cysteine cluster protein [Burkholderiaceae bacterium]|nr:YkgJ family cysteine cluster protein [Burkholderiaceae bacterium]